MTWQNILRTIMNMPALQELECGYNRFTEACFYSDDHVNLTTPVHTLNLDNNQIGGWRNVYLSFLDFPSYGTSTYLMGLVLLIAWRITAWLGLYSPTTRSKTSLSQCLRTSYCSLNSSRYPSTVWSLGVIYMLLQPGPLRWSH